MCSCTAFSGYRGATWWTSKVCMTPEEILTCCSAILGTATGKSLTISPMLFGVPVGKPPGIELGISVVSLGGASALLTMAMFPGLAIGGRNSSLSRSLPGFAVEVLETGLGARLWSCSFFCSLVDVFALEAGVSGSAGVSDRPASLPPGLLGGSSGVFALMASTGVM